MATTKKTTTKKEPVKIAAVVTYTMKALISTGPYSNLQPEITVMTGSVEEGYALVKEHIDMLHARYFNCLEKKPEPKKDERKTDPVIQATVQHGDSQVGYKPVSDGFLAAEKLVNDARTPEALSLIKSRIEGSAKLTEVEKATLLEMINNK